MGTTRSNAFTVSIENAPTWFTSLAEKTWATIAGGAGQRITDVVLASSPPGNTGRSIVAGAYAGGCVLQDTGELILPCNGGHADYAGNEVYALPLRTATPAWTCIKQPTPNAQIVLNTGVYADGAPSSVHGWGRAAAGNGKIVLASLEAVYNSGQTVYKGFMLDRTTLQWQNCGDVYTGADVWSADGLTAAGCSAYDPVSGKVYNAVGLDKGFDRKHWTLDTFTGAKAMLPGVTGNNREFRWCAIADDLRLWILGAPNQNLLYVMDISNPNANMISVPFTGTMPTDGAGCVYHNPSRALLLWHNDGTNVIKLKIPTNPLSGTYAFSTIAAAGGPTPSVSTGSQPYGRFNIVQNMGNGQACLVLCTSISGPTYVYKLPVGEVS